jgi:hypothetical protein
VRAADDPRFPSAEWQAEISARGREFVAQLERNQTPEGGWGYYDHGVYTERPKMHTSFATACVLPSLDHAYRRGWGGDPGSLDRARAYVEGCALPGGAWAYGWNALPRVAGESINQVKGSLGRIQVCHWALRSIGVQKITLDRVREGLDSFFEHHRFLDVARMRPIPHEAYYANASYFYFFAHYYAAEAIRLLPPEERPAYFARLRPHLAKVQNADGSFVDTPNSHYFWIADSAFAALALDLTLGG